MRDDKREKFWRWLDHDDLFILRVRPTTPMKRRCMLQTTCLLPVALSLPVQGRDEVQLGATQCDGHYAKHLQGVCTNDRDTIYWCWTDVLVKTDGQGRVLKQVPVANHHGDLCHHDGCVYVAVNLGRFNEPPGKADSWVYVYDADTLEDITRHSVPELVHGAGGIAFNGGRFIVVGGLPPGVNENYLYEYDEELRFRKRHVLASGYTLMGIQTAAHANGAWWFGCYGRPAELLRADADFRHSGRWEFNASLGIAPLGGNRFLIGQNNRVEGKGHEGRVVLAHADESAGLVLEKP